MVTINETDNILGLSYIINSDRLGNTLGNLNSNIINYFNFGHIPESDDKHRLCIAPTINNYNAKLFFESVFTGKRVSTGHLDYDRNRNCFHVK